VILILLWVIHSQLDTGEPFAWFEGISLWPSVLLKILALAFAILFLCSGYRKIRSRSTALRYYLLPYKAPLQAALDQGKDHPARDLYCQYHRLSNPKVLICRVTVMGTAYFLLGVGIVLSFGKPHVPFRGATSLLMDQLATYVSVFFLIILISGVLYTTHLSVWLIRQLSRREITWSRMIRTHILKWKNSKSVDSFVLCRWTDIGVIARHTKAMAQLIYYPFIVMLLMLIARGRYFDNWNMPLGLCMVILLSLIYAIYCAIALRRAAEKARRTAIEKIKMARFKESVRLKPSEKKVDQFNMIIETIRSMREGAFASIPNQPWVQSLALFFGGSGSLVFLNYLSG
jgi:hypothetical protein